MARALAGDGESDVPCAGCTACCEGSYFIHVTPEDAPARARIDDALLFPAPGAGPGHQLLGYDGQGRCPMLRDSGCVIYSDRPRTCRVYDCRIFAATGLAEPGAEKAAIMARAARWRFDYADARERARHEGLMAGTWLLLTQGAEPAGTLPGNATQLAMLCVRLHGELIRLAEAPEAGRPDALAGIRRAIAAGQSAG